MTAGQSAGSRGLSRLSTGAMSAATASRPVSGPPSGQRSRRVRMTEVFLYTSVTTVRGGIQAEIAIAGTRGPERCSRNGRRHERRRDVIVGAAVLVEGHHEVRVPGVGAALGRRGPDRVV